MGGACARGALRVGVPPRLPRARLAWARSRAACVPPVAAMIFSLLGALRVPQAGAGRASSLPCVARRRAARRVGDIAHARAAGAMRHWHCTRRGPAARSRVSSCHSGRRGPSSRLVAQHLRLPYHSHVPVGARANVALWLVGVRTLVASTSRLCLLVGAAGGARPRGAARRRFLSGVGGRACDAAPRGPWSPGDRRTRMRGA